ncbi:hypothetical protein FN3523_0731 [Francisella hispaniensis]|uniref:Uncharacterized protein n=1 Tax=Francisella hispaniensis TaxID=622488 RepID=F4BK94_9GAMM|nr:hypothetical protein FN3523_0731 [Francisella hispaniensis]
MEYIIQIFISFARIFWSKNQSYLKIFILTLLKDSISSI